MCGGRIGLGREDEMNENVSGITNSWDRKVYLADFDVIKKKKFDNFCGKEGVTASKKRQR